MPNILFYPSTLTAIAMMKYILYFLALFSFAQPVASQGQTDSTALSLHSKLKLAKWFSFYNTVVWWTTDSMLASSDAETANLKPVWFCFDEPGGWHALYGSYERGGFQMAFHYTVDSLSRVKRVYLPIDSSMANAYSRALIGADMLCKPLKDSMGIPFNRYVLRGEDSSVIVWVFPAFSKESGAVYGAELCYRFDKTGIQLLEKQEYVQQCFRFFKIGRDRVIWLDYKDLHQPTLGAVYFAWYYRKYFPEIWIENKTSETKLSYDQNDGQYYWVHGYGNRLSTVERVQRMAGEPMRNRNRSALDTAATRTKREFNFRDIGLRELMLEVGRWYGYEVEFEGELPQGTSRMKLNEDVALRDALKSIKKNYGVAIRIIGKKLVVKGKKTRDHT